MGSPFEPMDTMNLKHMTINILFPIILTTAKGVGELQALLVTVAHCGEDRILSYLPEFEAKTEIWLHLLPMVFLLQSLTALLASDDENCLLCSSWFYIITYTRQTSQPCHLCVA